MRRGRVGRPSAPDDATSRAPSTDQRYSTDPFAGQTVRGHSTTFACMAGEDRGLLAVTPRSASPSTSWNGGSPAPVVRAANTPTRPTPAPSSASTWRVAVARSGPTPSPARAPRPRRPGGGERRALPGCATASWPSPASPSGWPRPCTSRRPDGPPGPPGRRTGAGWRTSAGGPPARGNGRPAPRRRLRRLAPGPGGQGHTAGSGSPSSCARVATTSSPICSTRASTESNRARPEAGRRSAPWPARRRGRRRSRADGPREARPRLPRRRSDAGRGRSPPVDRAVGPLVPAGVDAVGGQADLLGHGHVGGRKPERPAPGVSSLHHAPHLVQPPEHGGRAFDVAGGQALPDAGRRHRLATPGVGHEPQAVDVEAVLGPHALQQGDVAPPAMAEVEVVAHHDGLGGHAAHQHLGHELLGRLLRAGLVEMHDEGVVDAGHGQQFQLLVQVGQQLGGRLRPDHHGRDGGRRSRPPRRTRAPAAMARRPGG